MNAISAVTHLPPKPQRPRPARLVLLEERLAELDEVGLGTELCAAVRELYPICRSITGEGVRRSLRLLQRIAPIALREIPTGTRVFDWVVPREWNLRRARLIGPRGEVVADASRSNLEVLGYSIPFRGQVSLEALQPHLHSLPDRPEFIPYRSSFYRDDWGFCLSHSRREALAPGMYQVEIDTTLEPGALTLGEVYLPGEEESEVLISTHTCHPSLANDNLSGMVVAAALARALAGVSLRHSYRFLFGPVTIGAIAWLAQNEAQAQRVRHGIVLAGVGDQGPLTWKRSRQGDAEIDRAVARVLSASGEEFALRDFSPHGYDERQYCSPGFDLPVGCLSRTPYGEYPEYHTSADTPDLVLPQSLAATVRRCLEVFALLEGNRRWLNLAPRGEPHLGKRGLYSQVGGQGRAPPDQMAVLWVLNLSDGDHSLLDIAERSKLPFEKLEGAAQALHEVGLLAPLVPAPRL